MNLLVFEPSEWGKEIPAHDERAEHIRKVLRLKPGDTVRVGCLGKGSGLAKLKNYEGTNDKTCVLDWPDHLEALPQALPLILVLAQVRPLVMQRLFKDLASLGLDEIWVCEAELSEASYSQASFWLDKKYESYLLEGAAQGALARVPEIRRFSSLEKALHELDSMSGYKKIVCHPGAYPVLYMDFLGLSSSSPLALAIGPERGWTAKELDQLRFAGFDFRSLGSRILRTELAVSALVVMANLAQGLNNEQS